MASVVIRKAWFTRPNVGVLAKVPASGANAVQISEAAFVASLAPWFATGTRTTTPAGATLAGNVASSTPAGTTTQAAGTPVAYVVAV